MIKIVNLINSWAQGIVIAVIVGAIIEIIVPDSKNKKYIKMVIGMYLLFVILYPIINKITGKSINLNSIDISKYMKTNTVSLDINKYVDTTYENNLKQEMKLFLKEKEYEARDIKLKFGKTYEDINEVSLEITRIENSNNNVNEVKSIEINTKSNVNNKTNDLNQDEISNLKEELAEFLNIDMKKITIN